MRGVREAVAADVPALVALGEATFRETFLDGGFAVPYPPEDLAAWLPTAYNAAKFARRIADPDCGVWVGEHDGRMLGYATAGPCGLPHTEATAAQGELYQLYVLRAGQGTGLGSALFDMATGWLAGRYPGPLWLGVWSGNEKAQAFYRKRGFDKVGDYQFPVGRWRDDEFIFRRD